MIDTVKVFTMIDKKTYSIINHKSNIRTMYNKGTGEIFYEIVNDNLQGSYDSSLSVRVGTGEKYKFLNSYYIEIEGSFHKIMRGYNSHDGYYDVQQVVFSLIQLVGNAYNIKLPKLKHWFLQRCDIAIAFDLENQFNIKNYINRLGLLKYPKRNLKYYENESIYCPGYSTTLKIYNKYMEYKKHDRSRLKDSGFLIYEYETKIQGLIRFECEIKKKKLLKLYQKNYIRVEKVKYEELEKIWSEEFMKILKFNESNVKKIRNRDDVRRRLDGLYKSAKANALYGFWLSIVTEGYDIIRFVMGKSTFYRKISDLKKAGIDFSQSCYATMVDFEYEEPFEFDPFTATRVS